LLNAAYSGQNGVQFRSDNSHDLPLQGIQMSDVRILHFFESFEEENGFKGIATLPL
jgi:hypothetical protein